INSPLLRLRTTEPGHLFGRRLRDVDNRSIGQTYLVQICPDRSVTNSGLTCLSRANYKSGMKPNLRGSAHKAFVPTEPRDRTCGCAPRIVRNESGIALQADELANLNAGDSAATVASE